MHHLERGCRRLKIFQRGSRPAVKEFEPATVRLRPYDVYRLVTACQPDKFLLWFPFFLLLDIPFMQDFLAPHY